MGRNILKASIRGLFLASVVASTPVSAQTEPQSSQRAVASSAGNLPPDGSQNEIILSVIEKLLPFYARPRLNPNTCLEGGSLGIKIPVLDIPLVGLDAPDSLSEICHEGKAIAMAALFRANTKAGYIEPASALIALSALDRLQDEHDHEPDEEKRARITSIFSHVDSFLAPEGLSISKLRGYLDSLVANQNEVDAAEAKAKAVSAAKKKLSLEYPDP